MATRRPGGAGTGTRPARGVAWLLSAALLLSACAQLPPPPPHAVSTASQAWEGTAWGQTAQRSLPAGASGFQLMPVASVAYGARLALAERAQQTLDVQYYVLSQDETGKRFMRALRDAARRGVRVRLLVDDVHTAGDDGMLAELAAEPHAEVRVYNPFPAARDSALRRWLASLLDFRRVDHRMHNKLFVADNALAVFGGRNIGDPYFMRGADSNFVDLDVLAGGPVVRELSRAFDEYWNSEFVYSIQTFARHDPRTDPAILDAPGQSPVPVDDAPQTDLRRRYSGTVGQLAEGRVALDVADATIIFDPPDKSAGSKNLSREGTVRGDLSLAIRSAREEVVVASPYFVPGEEGMEAMRALRARGVRLRLLTNSLAATDEPLVHVGYARYREEMVQLGVDVREIGPGLVREHSRLGSFGRSLGQLHAKVAVIDRRSVFIGSMNFDPRSERRNTEIGVLMESPGIARQVLELMDVERTAYRVRLAADGESLEWVYLRDGHEIVWTDEPEASLGRRVQVRFWWPFVPESEL
jgi:putative cardiolipin synthase